MSRIVAKIDFQNEILIS